MKKIYFKGRDLHLKNEILNVSFCFLIDAGFSKKIIREKAVIKDFKSLNINQNICYLTKRRYSVFKNYRLSRISFRNFAILGFICGIRRSCW
uniref:Ribosomal protein S14 n=1 Tax=Phaeocystis globosa TaxID=33658 RepID=A0A8A1RXG1_9EUKA|nr:ribosomal protein S14 [Phaeocystis globosa]QST19728.1 ribosomal protein S14 [Phaeocystis globosa]